VPQRVVEGLESVDVQDEEGIGRPERRALEMRAERSLKRSGWAGRSGVVHGRVSIAATG